MITFYLVVLKLVIIFEYCEEQYLLFRDSWSVVLPPFLSQVLQDMVPPKKHLLRHQPANAQIGLMEGNTFCTTLQPRLFTMDLNVVEHKVFYTEVGGWWCGVVWMVMTCVW